VKSFRLRFRDFKPSDRSPVVLRFIYEAALHLSTASIVTLVGETIFRGVAETEQWITTSPSAVVITILFLAIVLFGLQIFASFVGASIAIATIYWILSLANQAKVAKLGIPATPTDLLLSQQYLEVSYMMWGRWAYAALATCAVFAVAVIWWLRKRRRLGKYHNGVVTPILQASAILAVIYVVAIPDYNYYTARFRRSPIADAFDNLGIHNRNFDPLSNVTVNGQLIAFLMNVRAAMIHPPEGYDAERVKVALPPITSTQSSETSQPNVVIIMSEAFWDPEKLPGTGYSDSLLRAARTTERGTLFSPVFGGYTANTEFEVLSRVSNGLLPVGSIPYVQYVTRPTPSLASDFAAAGYETIAIHPFDGNFWNRRRVYTDFGFQTFDDRDSFVHRDMTGPFINDHALGEEINMMLDRSPGPHFIFAVSLQSHAPYTGGKYRYLNRVTVRDDAGRLTEDARDQLSTYASGVRDAVAGFNEVVAHAQKSNRKTIVVMFGDHLPALGDDYMLYRQTGYLSTSNPAQWSFSDQERMHGVPLLVWTNGNTPMDMPQGPFSPVYLGYRIKQMAGVKLTRVDELMRRMASAWPIISQIYSKDSAGHAIHGMPTDSLVTDYAIVTYDLLMGKQYAQSDDTAPRPP